MSLFENYVRETQQIELEIERKGVALGLDWDNELQIREIARKALAGPQKEVSVAFHNLSWNDRAMLELFALSQLMLTVMQLAEPQLLFRLPALGVVDADKLRERLSLHVEHQPG